MARAAIYKNTNTHINALNEIKTRDPTKLASADLRLTPQGDQDRNSPNSTKILFFGTKSKVLVYCLRKMSPHENLEFIPPVYPCRNFVPTKWAVIPEMPNGIV
jgi:hypothetical protein